MVNKILSGTALILAAGLASTVSGNGGPMDPQIRPSTPGVAAETAQEPQPAPSPQPPEPTPPTPPPPTPAPTPSPAPTVPPASPAPTAPTPEQAEAQRLALEAVGFIRQGDFEHSQAKLDEALGKDPSNLVANTFMAFLAFRSGDLDRARGHGSRVLALAPSSPLVLLILARIDEATDKPDLAAEGYARTIQSGESSPTAATDGGMAIAAHAHFLLALHEMKKGDNAAALSDLDAMQKIFPKNVNALYEKAMALLGLGRDAEAADVLSQVLANRASWIAPESWLFPERRYLFIEENSHFWRGVALHHEGKLQEAVDELTPLLSMVESRILMEIPDGRGNQGPLRPLEGDLDVSYYDAHLELARTLKDLGQSGRAVSTLKSLLRLDLLDKSREEKARQLLKEIR